MRQKGGPSCTVDSNGSQTSFRVPLVCLIRISYVPLITKKYKTVRNSYTFTLKGWGSRKSNNKSLKSLLFVYAKKSHEWQN